MKTLELFPLSDTPAQTSSLLAGHVSRHQSPDSRKASMMIAGSGRNLLGLWERFAQDTPFLKTLRACLLSKPVWYSDHVWMTWKAKVTPCNRLLFQLVPKARSIDGIESGLLPTPNTEQGGQERSGDRAGTGSIGWMARAGLLPTPNVMDATSRQYQTNKNTGQIILCLPGIAGGRLNPRFVEAMMLYPDNWTHPTKPSGKRLALDDVEPTTTERGIAPRIKMLGNAIVPDVVAEIGRAILEVENESAD